MSEIHQHIISDQQSFQECCEYLSTVSQFGLDTEFIGEDRYQPDLCLIQVATEGQLILIDPLALETVAPFWEIVADPNKETIVHAGREEIRFCLSQSGKSPGNLVDLQLAAGLVGLDYPMGHSALVKELLGVQLHKTETLTNWRERPLTRKQIQYAYDDVRYLLPLWSSISQHLEQLDRKQWLQEECLRLIDATITPPTTTEKWRKLKGLGNLNRRQLAIARELFSWREQLADRLNRPPRAVCRDDLIIEIAKRNPTKVRDLKVIRGLAHRDLQSILDAVKQAKSLESKDLPKMKTRIYPPPQLAILSNLIIAVLTQLCMEQQLSKDLVASNQDIRHWLQHSIQASSKSSKNLLNTGWRREHILPILEDVLQGKLLITITDIKNPNPISLQHSETLCND